MLPRFQREILGDFDDLSQSFASWGSRVRAGQEWGLALHAFGTGDRISRGRCHDNSLRRGLRSLSIQASGKSSLANLLAHLAHSSILSRFKCKLRKL